MANEPGDTLEDGELDGAPREREEYKAALEAACEYLDSLGECPAAAGRHPGDCNEMCDKRTYADCWYHHFIAKGKEGWNDMRTFLIRFTDDHDHIYEAVREKAFQDSRTAGKDVSRHSLMLELLEAGLAAKERDDPKWREVVRRFKPPS